MSFEQRRGEHGTAAFEAAVSFVAFFLLLFGIMEAGRFLNVQGALTNAAREGARLAVTPLRGTSTLPSAGMVEAEVERFMTSAGIHSARLTVSVTPETRGGTTFTAVRVSMPYRFVSLALFRSLEVTISGNSLMRNETSG